ncbi:DUF6035 family protein [Sphingobium algorifonticola]|jgi:hypothetical protein|uniref:Competence protein n=1 Tax=Sphingobium algorifonticola TaxID=2008318 RepID=A0A437J354_9SPHN|nr:DUF6035 family protein [Sphingobium algorifonticola]MBA4766307.1 hypothetical protein [Porphyrobacter sp.]RVT38730.1 hypothetical protein ENE74_17260 [Sphingobium algorifonticola]
MTMVGNTTVDPLAWAEAVTKPEIDAVRNPRTGHVLNVRRLIRAFRYERAILLRQRLKALVKSDEARLVCAMCGVPVYLACSTTKRFFFRHRHEDGSCPAVTRTDLSEADIRAMKYRGAQESGAHKRVKALLLRSLSADPRFKDVASERTWRASEGLCGLRRPDVSARTDTDRLAFEVQLSTTFMDVVLSRKEFYRAEGAALVWVLPFFHPSYRRMTDDDILFGNNSNVFVVDEKSAAASERAGTFIMTCWYRKPLIQGDKIVDEWVERLVCWDEVTVDVDRQTIIAFDYGHKAARLREELRAARLERIAAAEATERQAREDRENELREQVLCFVLDASRDDVYLPRHKEWLLLNDRLCSIGFGLEGEYPNLQTATRIVHLIESARAGKPVGFRYKSFAELGHHLIHQHPELLLAFGHMLRRFGTRDALYSDDRTGKLRAKLDAIRSDLTQDPKYRMAKDEERLCAFLSMGASRKAQPDNDNRDQQGREAA